MLSFDDEDVPDNPELQFSDDDFISKITPDDEDIPPDFLDEVIEEAEEDLDDDDEL